MCQDSIHTRLENFDTITSRDKQGDKRRRIGKLPAYPDCPVRFFKGHGIIKGRTLDCGGSQGVPLQVTLHSIQMSILTILRLRPAELMIIVTNMQQDARYTNYR
ncbi:hypothetical protein CLAM6_21300 [Cobetia sp. AM6]|nr:hypothetical protein CLAM6_21300 [Cobetia sp. AM6]